MVVQVSGEAKTNHEVRTELHRTGNVSQGMYTCLSLEELGDPSSLVYLCEVFACQRIPMVCTMRGCVVKY